jgi:hypothetical protein
MTVTAGTLKDHVVPMFEGDWSDPDWSLVDEGLAPAPILPLALLRSWGPWIADYAAMKSAPTGYVLGIVLAAAAACIGAARKVRARFGWESYTALWVLLVGPPSANKTPPLSPITAILKDIEREESEGFEPIRRAYETKRQAAKEARTIWESAVEKAVRAGNAPPEKPPGADEPEEPRPPKIVVTNPTIERMVPILKHSPRGVILVRDELAGFVGNFGKYGGDGDAAFWLERYDGGAFSSERVKSGDVEGDIGLASIIGGIQPEPLAELLFSRADDGFVSRLLMIYPEPVPRVWATPVADMDRIRLALTRLRGVAADIDAGRLTPRIVPLADDAKDLFSRWWIDNGAAGEASTGFQAGVLGKGPGVVLRLALVLEYLEWAAGDGPEPVNVCLASIAAAIGLFEDYLLPSAYRVFGGAARDKKDLAAAMLLKKIRHVGERVVNAKTVYRTWRLPGLTTAPTVKAALDRLSEAGWARSDPGEPDAKGGRPAGNWSINPLLWGADREPMA